MAIEAAFSDAASAANALREWAVSKEHMIKKLIDKLLGKPSGRSRKPDFGRRVEIPPSVHRINPELVDERAVTVTRTLRQAGYEAYVVGGAVRDLLLGLRPKDFDVATNATPEQVKSLFRRAFIIGRRFRIVHVVFGRGRDHEVIEVSTFRAYMDAAAAEAVTGNEKTGKQALAGMQHAVDTSGRVLRDNVWGPQDEDATRRDFTVNALYYEPESQILVDYHRGIDDSAGRLLRLIGDPVARYREDPVRILRAVRFAAKLAPLGFRLEPRSAKPLVSMRGLLSDVPQSRLFDEMLKLLQTGHGVGSVAQLQALGLGQGVYPLLDLIVERSAHPFIAAALSDTDRRVGESKPVAPSFLLACVLWPDVQTGWQQRISVGEHTHPAMQSAIDVVFDERIGDVSGRGKLGADMREIWMMQLRFDRRIGTTPYSLVEQPRFRAGFDFLRLRADVGEVDVALADWWQEFSVGDDSVREDLIQQIRDSNARKPRRVRDTRGGSGETKAREAGSSPLADEMPSRLPMSSETGSEPEGATPVRKRRRRRRRAGGDPSVPPEGS